jgi:hypothetical protein
MALIWQAMRAAAASPLILLEVPHVSLRLNWRAKAVDDVAHAAAQILWRHSYGDACFVAHSYGTFCVSRIAQLHASLVHSMVRARPVQAALGLSWACMHLYASASSSDCASWSLIASSSSAHLACPAMRLHKGGTCVRGVAPCRMQNRVHACV